MDDRFPSLVVFLCDPQEHYNFSFDMDYEVARIFRNHIIPNAVLWFTGEAVSDDDEDGEDDDDEEEEVLTLALAFVCDE